MPSKGRSRGRRPEGRAKPGRGQGRGASAAKSAASGRSGRSTGRGRSGRDAYQERSGHGAGRSGTGQSRSDRGAGQGGAGQSRPGRDDAQGRSGRDGARSGRDGAQGRDAAKGRPDRQAARGRPGRQAGPGGRGRAGRDAARNGATTYLSDGAPPFVRQPVEPDIAVEGEFRAGYVALIGRPNVGKSTLLNHLLGTKLAATTHKPQTTRKNLLGILMPKGAQLLLLDTPGYHQAKGPLNRYMVDQARQAIDDADVIGYVVEARADGNITPGNERILEALKTSDKPVVLLPNKIDRVKDKQGLLLQLQAYSQVLGERMKAAVPISAHRGSGLREAVTELAKALPESPALFDGDTLTDAPEKSVAAEFVREKVMLATKDELPYAAAVTIDLFEDARPKIVRIIATIHVERASQKPIVIGRHGDLVKQIGTSARRDLELFLQSKVYLELHVRVTEEWSNRPRGLVELGYGQEGTS